MGQHLHPRRSALLKNLPDETAVIVWGWARDIGYAACAQRLCKEMNICGPTGRPVVPSTVANAVAYWETKRAFLSMQEKATLQIEQEKASEGLTPDQMQDAIDRRFIALAADKDDTKLYREMRMLRIAAEKSHTKALIERRRFAQRDRQIAQKDQEIELATRRVSVLETKVAEARDTLEDSTLSPEDREILIREILKK